MLGIMWDALAFIKWGQLWGQLYLLKVDMLVIATLLPVNMNPSAPPNKHPAASEEVLKPRNSGVLFVR
jgi:hypothetical protein